MTLHAYREWSISILPAFEILAREDLNPGDVWKGFRIGRKHKN